MGSCIWKLNYKGVWCELNKTNTEKFLKSLDAFGKREIEIRNILKEQFMQSSVLKNFDVIEKFREICEEHKIAYTMNSWCSDTKND